MLGGITVKHFVSHIYQALLLASLLALSGCPQGKPGGTAQPGSATAGKPPAAASRTPATNPDPAATRDLSIWADPVLVPALTGLAKDYHAASGGSYTVTPVERGALLAWAKGTQGRTGDVAGKPVPDVLLFAGQSTYTALLAAKRMDEASARTFAGDRLVVMKPLGTAFTSPSLFDLWDLHFKHFAVADPEQTALGLYSHQALVTDGVEKRLASRTHTYADSTVLPGLPGQNDSTLAIAFMSQSGGAMGVEPLLLVEKSLHEAIQYRAVAVSGKGADLAVLAFLRWLAEDDATQTALGGYGLLGRAVAMGLAAPMAGNAQP